LTTLHEAGWLRPAEGGGRRQWSLSPKILTLARFAEPAPGLRDHAPGVMEELRGQTGETIHLMMRDGGDVVLIERLDSPQVLRIVRPLGARAPLHLTANGKAILARLGMAERNAYLRGNLASWTVHSLSDPEILSRHLDDIAQLGYAVNDGELDLGVRAVGAAILNGAGRPVASLSISGPASRIGKEEVGRYGGLARDAARRITDLIAVGRSDG